MRKDVSGGQRSKFKKSEKMMRKDVAGGEEVQNQNIRKNDEKKRCRRWILKIRKNDEKRRFKRWISKIPKKR